MPRNFATGLARQCKPTVYPGFPGGHMVTIPPSMSISRVVTNPPPQIRTMVASWAMQLPPCVGTYPHLNLQFSGSLVDDCCTYKPEIRCITALSCVCLGLMLRSLESNQELGIMRPASCRCSTSHQEPCARSPERASQPHVQQGYTNHRTNALTCQ